MAHTHDTDIFYTSITLRGPEQRQLVSYLSAMLRTAYVSPSTGGVTVVYDRESENQAIPPMGQFVGQLSGDFQCPALVALLHDGAFLWYRLYVAGEEQDEYNSSPWYYDAEAAEPQPPSGGNAERLCAAFEAEGALEEVRSLLREPRLSTDGTRRDLIAAERHKGLARLLCLPPYAAGIGYYHIEGSRALEGLNRSEIIKTTF